MQCLVCSTNSSMWELTYTLAGLCYGSTFWEDSFTCNPPSWFPACIWFCSGQYSTLRTLLKILHYFPCNLCDKSNDLKVMNWLGIISPLVTTSFCSNTSNLAVFYLFFIMRCIIERVILTDLLLPGEVSYATVTRATHMDHPNTWQ